MRSKVWDKSIWAKPIWAKPIWAQACMGQAHMSTAHMGLAHMDPSPYGPRPVWPRPIYEHSPYGPSPYGPRPVCAQAIWAPIWAQAHIWGARDVQQGRWMGNACSLCAYNVDQAYKFHSCAITSAYIAVFLLFVADMVADKNKLKVLTGHS